MEIIEIGDLSLDSAGKRIKRGEVFVYPTDTVYGIGCNIFNEGAVERIFKIKKRPKNKPLSVAFYSLEQLLDFVVVDQQEKEILTNNLPGPYTFVVLKKGVPDFVSPLETVGVRIPDYGPIREIIRTANTPIITTSANTSGLNPPATVYDISQEVVEAVDFVIDAGKCGSGRPSMIVDLVQRRILR